MEPNAPDPGPAGPAIFLPRTIAAVHRTPAPIGPGRGRGWMGCAPWGPPAPALRRCIMVQPSTAGCAPWLAVLGGCRGGGYCTPCACHGQGQEGCGPVGAPGRRNLGPKWGEVGARPCRPQGLPMTLSHEHALAPSSPLGGIKGMAGSQEEAGVGHGTSAAPVHPRTQRCSKSREHDHASSNLGART